MKAFPERFSFLFLLFCPFLLALIYTLIYSPLVLPPGPGVKPGGFIVPGGPGPGAPSAPWRSRNSYLSMPLCYINVLFQTTLVVCVAWPEAVSQAKPGPNGPGHAGPKRQLHESFGLA